MVIRFATVNDSKRLLEIYKQYIDTAISFEYVLPTEEEFAKRISSVLAKYPYLVCEDRGRIVGYAYAHEHMDRAAYQWNVELSVYIDRESVSGGIGKRLYAALISLLEVQGVKTAYALVTVPNEKSERLHYGFGFELIGIYHNTGYKNGKWHDVSCFEKKLSEYDIPPKPVIPVSDIPKEQIELILEN